MRPDIINAPALQAAINQLLEGASPPLQGQNLGWVRSALHRTIPSHDSVRKARRRKSDPGWAQAKFEEGQTLYRFDPEGFPDREIKGLMKDLGHLAERTEVNHSQGRMVEKFFRGLPHVGSDLSDLADATQELLSILEQQALKARRNETQRACIEVKAGPLVGTNCVTIDEIINLGREAQNCMATEAEYWRNFANGNRDFWALRQMGRLAAILEVDGQNRVNELLAPSNRMVSIRDAGPIAAFCQSAGFVLQDPDCGVLPAFAEPALIERRVIDLGSRLAIYSEWPRAVRIDIRKKRHRGGNRNLRRALWDATEHTLCLSFDPDLSCAEEVMAHQERQDEVASIGRKKLRKIMRSVALEQTNPTLVQHRLLTLAT